MKAVLSAVGLAVPTFLLFYMCACVSAPAPERAPAPAVAPNPVAVPVDAPERHFYSREGPTREVPQVEVDIEEPQHRVMSRAFISKPKKVKKDKNID
jgi:hypothetical protein